jgi:hypothetical protein
MTTTTTTPAELLARAADIIDRRGWFQGSYADDNGCVCTLGALRVAAANIPADAPYWEVRAAALDLPGRFLGPNFDEVDKAALALEEYLDNNGINAYGVSEWNDYIAATKEEVTTVLRAAAAEGAES